MLAKILVVDDDDSIRLLVTRFLSRLGYEVENASDGAAAIEKLSAGTFELMLVDLMMPRLDGFGVIEFLGTLADPPQAIVMTAAAPALVARLPRELVWKVITKPFDLSVLESEAAAALRARREFLESPS